MSLSFNKKCKERVCRSSTRNCMCTNIPVEAISAAFDASQRNPLRHLGYFGFIAVDAKELDVETIAQWHYLTIIPAHYV